MTKCNWAGLAVTVIASTLILFVTIAILPNGSQSNLLLVEAGRPLILAGAFSIAAGSIASWRDGRLRSGALGGALNALINVAMFLYVAGTFDRHFAAIGGRALIPWYPLALPYGILLGIVGARLRNLMPKRVPVAVKGKSA